MRRGTQAEAIAYCQKVETRAEPHEKMEFGTKAKAGGGQAGAGKRELVEARATATARPWTLRSLMRRLWT